MNSHPPYDEYDVIVVGGGGSGLAAAVSTAQQGKSVLLLEREPHLGGTTGMAVGSITANQTKQQTQASIVDSWQDHAIDAGQFAPHDIESKNNTLLRKTFLKETAHTLEWLTDMGLRFSGPHPEPPNRVARMHNVIPGAQAYIRTLSKELKRFGGQCITQANVRNLCHTHDLVSGLEYEHLGRISQVTARFGVVLAAGDYANSPSLIRKHKGKEFEGVEGINPKSTGDGHLLAKSAGAQLLNMDVTYGPEIRFIAPSEGFRFLQRVTQSHIPTPLANAIAKLSPGWLIRAIAKQLLITWQHPEDSLFRDGAILVNREGQRFCNELDSPTRELAITRQPHKQAYILLDQYLVEQYSKWPHFISTAPKIAYAYVTDYLKRRPDIALREDHPHKISETRSPLLAHLSQTVETYNRTQDADSFGRKDCRRKLRGNKWVLLGPAKSYFTTTEGGAAINAQCQALRKDGSPIKGLYAVGQNGLGGQILWGHGLHIAWAITSGRLVGEHFNRKQV
jgi:succinate dehydrogenase/fumarate reductase flavoprotein subunit